MEKNNQLAEFCNSVQKGFGSITDTAVKTEYERVYNKKIDPNNLGRLLALLEKHSLLDKKNSVNKTEQFYLSMYKKMNENIKTT